MDLLTSCSRRLICSNGLTFSFCKRVIPVLMHQQDSENFLYVPSSFFFSSHE
ncbi:unnamed protein product [Amoebophrya sp. A25]|nr:unnamed protein product [Amoebophrya sp. A25]|eukprot:GSA25T00001427001.1